MSEKEQDAGAPSETPVSSAERGFKYPARADEELLSVATEPSAKQTGTGRIRMRAGAGVLKLGLTERVAIRPLASPRLPTKILDRQSVPFGHVEEQVYDQAFAERMMLLRLAQSRRSSDWAEQWLSLEDEYDERCSRARSLLGSGVEDVALHDGHVAELVVTARALVDRGAEFLVLAPWIRHLHITSYADVGSELFEVHSLRGMQSLGLRAQGLTNDDVETLVKSPFIDGLRWLDLSANRLGTQSFAALAMCPALVHLEYLGLEGNESASPVDAMGTDAIDGVVISTVRTPAGRALEERAGNLKWLHAPSRFPHTYPPSPLDVAKTP